MGVWHRACAAEEVPPGTGKELTIGDRIVALFHVDGKFVALDGICPHAGGPLGQGTLQGAVVTCPWHGWQFDVTTGRHCLTERIRQPSFAVRQEGADLLVELP